MAVGLSPSTLISAMPNAALRIISLIPSATEIVAALGLESALAGRSHECDYPATVQALPICTAPNLDPQGTSREIHDRVEDLLQSALSIYRIDLDALERLRPTHILTQAQCEVCAVSLAEVEAAVAQLTDCSAQIISLQPSTLNDVWADIKRVAQALGVESDGVIAALEERVAAIQHQTQALYRPRVACIEWTEPLMAAGNWVPELVTLAGGENLFGTVGKHSPWMQWDELLRADPDVLVVMPCGFDLEQTKKAAIADLTQHPDWHTLKAVQQRQVYLTDGNQYFNRPGPRLVDSLEILAEIFHPDLNYGQEHQGWVRL